VNFIKNIISSSLVVQWNATGDIIDTRTRYVLFWSSGIAQRTIVTILTSVTITELTVNTTYTITVTAANKCGGGPEFRTSILFSPDTTSTTTIISPTVTTSTNPMTIVSTVIPSTTTTTTSKSSSTTTSVITSSVTTSTTATSIYPTVITTSVTGYHMAQNFDRGKF